MLCFYNTLTRKIEEFKPVNPPKVGIYTCGPTVYDYAHIGHARTYIFADILRRVLLYSGYQVKQVINITDVGHLVSDADSGEDKIEIAAQKAHKTPQEIAQFFEKDFWEMTAKLNIEKPEIVVKATDHIPEMIALVKTLEKKGYTYETSDGIYFDITKFSGYPKLGGFKLEEQKAGARVPVRGEKRNPHDFALWKKADPSHLQQWDSPWGRGFPGWHIECSAMSIKYLGEAFENANFHGDSPAGGRTIDIHTGGVDHIPTHHNNEIAQSEAATGKPFVNYWLHGEHLFVEDEKMAKSLQNFYRIADLEHKGFEPLAFRYLCLTVHYRTRLNFTWESIEGAQNALNSLYEEVRDWNPPKVGCAEFSAKVGPPVGGRPASGMGGPASGWEEKFLNAVNDDLNMPQALAVVWELVKSDFPTPAKAQSLLKFDQILGLDIDKYLGKKIEIPVGVQNLVKKRESLRQEKKWQEADRVRKEIEEKGFIVKDTAGGSVLKRKVN